MQKNTSTLSRRKVTAGIAWSVPAVAAVAAAPAFAASPTCVTATTGDVVKYPGNSTPIKQGYGFTITVTNPTRSRLRISGDTSTVDFDKKKDVTGTLLIFATDPCLGDDPIDADDDLLVLEPGETQTFYLVAPNTGSSSNESGCISATLGVQLVTGEQPVANLCDEYVVERACFSETAPDAC